MANRQRGYSVAPASAPARSADRHARAATVRTRSWSDGPRDLLRWVRLACQPITNADTQALQAPFRSGITIEDYQLDPVVRAIEMPRVNLLLARPRVGVPVRTAARRSAARQPTRARWRLLVPRRDLREGQRALVLSVPSRRSPRRPHRLDAQRTPRQACRAVVPSAAARSRRKQASTNHHGPAPGLPAGDPLDHRPQGSTSHDAVPQQLHRAEPPGCEAALLSDARFREIRISRTLLCGVR